MQMPPFPPPPPPPQMIGMFCKGRIQDEMLTTRSQSLEQEFLLKSALTLLKGIPQAHVTMIYLPSPQAPNQPPGPNWQLQGLPPPPPMRGARHRSWKGETDGVMHRPIDDDLIASESTCNAILKTRGPCTRKVQYQSDGYLPVCHMHKAKKVLAGRCHFLDDSGRCNTLIKYHPPFAQLCNDHRDWDGLPCYLLKLPVELRMHIFSYVLPDKPVNAWLDSPLRQDRQRTCFELLLVNRQIKEEAMDILYGSQPYTVGLGRENLVLCGGIYAHDKSEWPSVMVYNPPRTERTGNKPPMLKNIKHMRLQITFVNPGFPVGRPQHYPIWDEGIDLYDLRDSAKALVHLLVEENSLASLEVTFVMQNIFLKPWDESDVLRIMKTVFEPLLQLRGIPKATLNAPYQIHSPHRLSLTQFFADNVRVATSDELVAEVPPVKIPGNHVLSYRYSGHKKPTLIRVSHPLSGSADFAALRQSFQESVTSNILPDICDRYSAAVECFDSFRKVYHAVESHFRTVLPRGKNWLLHKARVAREDHDIEGIVTVRKELEEEVRRLVRGERDAIDTKERITLDVLQAFDRLDYVKTVIASEDGHGATTEDARKEGHIFGYSV